MPPSHKGQDHTLEESRP